VYLREFPAALLFSFEGGLVREELLADFLCVTGGSLILVDDDYAVVPARILARMQAGGVDGIVGDLAELFFFIEDGQLILLEDVEEFIFVTPLHAVDPLHDVRLLGGGSGCCGGLGKCSLRGSETPGRDEKGESC